MPIDTSSPLILHTDASTDELGWVLSQLRTKEERQGVYSSPHNIIAMGSSTLSCAQKRYSPVELEVLAISHSINKLDYFTRFSPLVRVCSDCSALVSIFNQDLSEVKNQRISRMFEKIMCINMEIKHIVGARNKMADYLSRYSLGDKDIPEIEIPRPFAASRSLSTIKAGIETRDPLVQMISEEGEKDEEYSKMIKCLPDNTPARNVSGSSELKVMESFPNLLSVEELSNNKCIIIKDVNEVLIPKTLRKNMMMQLHYTYLAPDSML